jgi:hypothetical protein
MAKPQPSAICNVSFAPRRPAYTICSRPLSDMASSAASPGLPDRFNFSFPVSNYPSLSKSNDFSINPSNPLRRSTRWRAVLKLRGIFATTPPRCVFISISETQRIEDALFGCDGSILRCLTTAVAVPVHLGIAARGATVTIGLPFSRWAWRCNASYAGVLACTYRAILKRTYVGAGTATFGYLFMDGAFCQRVPLHLLASAGGQHHCDQAY